MLSRRARFFVGYSEIIVVGLRRFEGEGSGLLQRSGRADRKEIVDFADGLRGFGGSERPAYTPTGDAVGFGHAVDDDGVVAHAIDLRHGKMLGAIVENVFVDFVGDAEGVPAQAKIADEFQLAARKNFSRGIVGRVDDDRFGAWAKGGGQFPFIEGPIGRMKLSQSAEKRRKESRRGRSFRRRARRPRFRRRD